MKLFSYTKHKNGFNNLKKHNYEQEKDTRINKN